MGKYSIKELERLSGIQAHTIRIWEKRHQLISPQRTATNIRFYSDDDLKRLINVAVLNNQGIKISKLAGLSNEEINRKIAELSNATNDIEVFIEQMIVAMIDLDQERFEELLGSLSLKFGFERTMLEIVYPFLQKIGVLWLTNKITPAQEHFISNLIRNKIIVATDALPLAPKTAPRLVLYLPENELHEIGLLFYHYITKKMGFRCYYLGQTVPYSSLKDICDTHHPDAIISSFTAYPTPQNILKYVEKMKTDFAHCSLYLTGYAVKKAGISSGGHLQIFENPLEIKSLLQRFFV